MPSEPKRENRTAATLAALCSVLIACALVRWMAGCTARVPSTRCFQAASSAPDIVLVLHVRDADGQDVPNARVLLWADGPVTSGPVWPPQAPLAGGGQTDSSGRFTLHAQGDNQL